MSGHKPHQSQTHMHEHGPYVEHLPTAHEGHQDHVHEKAPPHQHDAVEPKAIRPLHDRIVVECVKETDRSKGGIIIPDTAKEKPMEGHVLAVGSGKVLGDGSVRKVDVHVGDRVLFGKYGGTQVKLDGADRLIIHEDDILAVLEHH